jgi:choline dehydrogenase-like flavoprotein
MLFDADRATKPNETLPLVDICIIGSGAAGLTIAHELIGSGKSVTVLESSRVSDRHNPSPEHREALSRLGVPHPNPPYEHRYEDPTVQPVYAGTSDTDEPESKDFFLNQRVRVYGGTTNCWGGWTRPLAELDFNRAMTNPNWRWPIEPHDLADGYSRAMDYCSLGKREASAYDNPDFWVGKTVDDIKPLAPTKDLRTAVFTEMSGARPDDPLPDGRLDFQLVWGPAVEEATQIAIYRNANVTGFTWGGANIAKAKVRTVGNPGHEFFVQARKFVLAASCIENARLLLLSDSYVRTALGPALGKYLFTHPMVFNAATFDVGQIDQDASRRAAIQRFYCGRAKLKQPADHPPAVFAAFAPTPIAANTPNSFLGNFRATVGFGAPGSRGTVNFAWEQFPNVTNSIYLEEDDHNPDHYDMFGCLKARATLKLQKTDTDTLDKGLNLLRDGLVAMGVAVNKTWTRTDEVTYLPGAHAMGTTRMSASILSGVVNKDCQAHGIRNLYIAGSSVFPTGGYSNPTLTVIALAIRLADHLKT